MAKFDVVTCMIVTWVFSWSLCGHVTSGVTGVTCYPRDNHVSVKCELSPAVLNIIWKWAVVREW